MGLFGEPTTDGRPRPKREDGRSAATSSILLERIRSQVKESKFELGRARRKNLTAGRVKNSATILHGEIRRRKPDAP